MFSGLPVRSGVRTELPAERHLPGRECGIMASSADLIVRATPHTTMGDRAFAAPRASRTVYSTRSFAAHRWPPTNAL